MNIPFHEKNLHCPACKNSTWKIVKDEIQCQSCGLQYPAMDGKLFFIPGDKTWQSNSSVKRRKKNWTLWRQSNFIFFKERLAVHGADDPLLDLGVGDSQFRELTEPFKEYAGIDFRPYEDVTVVCDINSGVPFRDGSFSVVMASNVLEHLPDTEKVLGEVFRVLKPGGALYATIPFMLQVHQKPYDFHRYTNFMLERLLSQAGFADIKVTSINTPFDLYRTTQRHFFQKLFAENPFMPLGLRSLNHLLVKVLWNVEKFLNILGRAVFAGLSHDDGYTLGYSISARKSL